ncbi:MAG TPA: M28 family peptidase [Solirubrobacteraceae bacterium]|nr:M28 family peptidase [Solirubrobacteraceae bacterium]
MLNGRLYRAAFVPFLFVLAVAAFSLHGRPAPVTSTLAPDAFEGAPAFAELKSMAARYPQRRPGSVGDDELAGHVQRTLEGLGGTAGGGFSVHSLRFQAQTIDGERTITNVIAQRPGSISSPPILIVAHRDAAARGAQAELSGTAALLELARVFAARETKRTIILASTSGGSGGSAGASELVSELQTLGSSTAGGGVGGSPDAAIVLGDVAGTNTDRPLVVPFSDGLGSAPIQLQRTVEAAISHEVIDNPGSPSALAQLAHLVFPMALGEQAVLGAAGVPSVLIQTSGERGPAPGEQVSMERLEGFGRAALSAVDALDVAPDVSPTMQTGLLLAHKTMPMWVLRLLVLALLLPPLIAAVDGLARARRRRLPTGRWMLWTLSCALPFFSCALLAYLLGWLGILGATPFGPVLSGALPFAGEAVTAVVAIALTFALTWLLWSVFVRRIGWRTRPSVEVTGLAMVLVALVVTLLTWIANPLMALLAIPALHLWLLLAAPDALGLGGRSRRLASLALVALGVAPVVLLIVFYAYQFGLDVGAVAWAGVLLAAGGYVGLVGAILWSVALGCVAVAVMLALTSIPDTPDPLTGERIEVTIRGPMTYAGPGSLGGTESALRL